MCCSAGDGVGAKIDRLILAEDFFGHAELSADQALWRLLREHRPALPAPEHRTVAGEEIDEWRDTFRLIQGFELQSTLLPFIESHNVDLGSGIEERFEAAANSFAEADAARNKRKEIAQRLGALLPPGTVLVLPTTPTLPPEREYPRWRVVRRVPHANARLYLPRRPCRPAADLDSRDRGRRLPDRPVFYRLEERRRGLARSRRHARSHA